jgi:hypothetical protein
MVKHLQALKHVWLKPDDNVMRLYKESKLDTTIMRKYQARYTVYLSMLDTTIMRNYQARYTVYIAKLDIAIMQKYQC